MAKASAQSILLRLTMLYTDPTGYDKKIVAFFKEHDDQYNDVHNMCSLVLRTGAGYILKKDDPKVKLIKGIGFTLHKHGDGYIIKDE